MNHRVLSTIKNLANETANVVTDAVVGGNGPQRSWEELKLIEKKRREILRRSELPLMRILLFWDGTCLRVLFQDPLVWFTMSIFIATRVQVRLSESTVKSNISTSDIGIIGGFLSFFLVFFVVQSNTRFNMMYDKSMCCEGRILDIATLAKATLPRENGLRLIRYLNAAHVAGYIGLSNTYSVKNFFAKLNKTNKFLTKQEVKRMEEIDMDMGGSCYRELVSWCMMEVEFARKAKIIDGRIATQLREQLLVFRGGIGALYDFNDQPISFFYVHFLSFLSALYLPLFAVSASYSAGSGKGVYWTSDLLSGTIVMLQIIFVIGLRLLGLKMADPYGDDLEDLSVMHYINFTWCMSNRILMASIPAELDRELEERLVRRRLPIGDAWESHDEEVTGGVHDHAINNLDYEQSSRTAQTCNDDSESENRQATKFKLRSHQ